MKFIAQILCLEASSSIRSYPPYGLLSKSLSYKRSTITTISNMELKYNYETI
ncbi:hypothetical protein ALT785_370048 [Alteromonas infernus]